jgi:hypothetical protein
MRRYERVDRDGDREAQVRGENNRLRGDMHRRKSPSYDAFKSNLKKVASNSSYNMYLWRL